MRIAELRREYNLGSLRRDDLEPNPLTQFANWLGQARAARGGGRLRKFFVGFYKLLLMVAGAPPLDVTAMTLATADKSGRPSARVVLLKNVDERGFVFFTNYESRKGRELTENPQAALVFYWPDLERQVCVSGNVSKLPEQESDDYFKSRPRASRLAAWASRQSQVIADKAQLVQQWIASETRFQQQEPPRPDFWGGYVLSPTRIEFWQGGPSRLHDRFCYTRQADKQWVIERLSP
jgi:pyridoxamine 5'-phosphate oxidase